MSYGRPHEIIHEMIHRRPGEKPIVVCRIRAWQGQRGTLDGVGRDHHKMGPAALLERSIGRPDIEYPIHVDTASAILLGIENWYDRIETSMLPSGMCPTGTR